MPVDLSGTKPANLFAHSAKASDFYGFTETTINFAITGVKMHEVVTVVGGVWNFTIDKRSVLAMACLTLGLTPTTGDKAYVVGTQAVVKAAGPTFKASDDIMIASEVVAKVAHLAMRKSGAVMPGSKTGRSTNEGDKNFLNPTTGQPMKFTDSDHYLLVNAVPQCILWGANRYLSEVQNTLRVEQKLGNAEEVAKASVSAAGQFTASDSETTVVFKLLCFQIGAIKRDITADGSRAGPGFRQLQLILVCLEMVQSGWYSTDAELVGREARANILREYLQQANIQSTNDQEAGAVVIPSDRLRDFATSNADDIARAFHLEQTSVTTGTRQKKSNLAEGDTVSNAESLKKYVTERKLFEVQREFDERKSDNRKRAAKGKKQIYGSRSSLADSSVDVQTYQSKLYGLTVGAAAPVQPATDYARVGQAAPGVRSGF